MSERESGRGTYFPPNAGAQWFWDWGGAQGERTAPSAMEGGAVIKRGDSGWVSVRYGEILSFQMRHDPPECTLEAPPSSCPLSAKCPSFLLFSFYTSLFLSLLLLFSFLSFHISHFFVSVLFYSALRLVFFVRFVFSFPHSLLSSSPSFLLDSVWSLCSLLALFSSLLFPSSSFFFHLFISPFHRLPFSSFIFSSLFTTCLLLSSSILFSSFLLVSHYLFCHRFSFLVSSVCLFCSCPFPPFFVFTLPHFHLLVPCT